MKPTHDVDVFHVKLPKQLAERLRDLANREARSFNAVLRLAVTEIIVRGYTTAQVPKRMAP